MIATDPRMEREALDWARRVADPEFSDWEAHLHWLEQNAGHAEAFGRACLDMEAMTVDLAPAGRPPAASMTLSANDNPVAPARAHRPRWWFGAAGGAIAASVAGLLLISPRHPPAAMRIIETAPGATRAITMADGTRITLNGGSRIEIAQGDTRGVAIVMGEGFFDVVHDDRRPFSVRAGDTLIRDVGTAFDVAVDTDTTRVAVREGEVALGADNAVRLKAGQGARIDRGGTIVRGAINDPASAGGWRQGRLVYRDALLADVAADLGRSLGAPVSFDPGIAARRFTGVIAIDADHDLTIRRLAASAGLAVSREGTGWHLALR
ncbi:MAG: iron dicitrate transport regulator FecR [Sphingomonas bacterium]|nr:iron dicitrate transport regulator FecR [Sphingomonas bacterium]